MKKSLLMVLTFGSGALLVGAACASAPRPVAPRNLEFARCPGFVVTPTRIDVGPAGGTFDIQPRHRIEFWPNAVSRPSSYQVRRGGNADLAEIEILPLDGAVTEFDADVILQVSYTGCPDAVKDQTDRYVLVETHPRNVSIGGRDRKAPDFYVRALVAHLTMFAIAH